MNDRGLTRDFGHKVSRNNGLRRWSASGPLARFTISYAPPIFHPIPSNLFWTFAFLTLLREKRHKRSTRHSLLRCGNSPIRINEWHPRLPLSTKHLETSPNRQRCLEAQVSPDRFPCELAR